MKKEQILKAKSAKVYKENVKLKETIKEMNDKKIAIMGNNGEALFIKKFRKVYYIDSVKEDGREHCINCGKNVKTTAHHLIPIRAKCIHPILKELRVRVCDDCDKYIHPELKMFEEFFKEWRAGNHDKAQEGLRRK